MTGSDVVEFLTWDSAFWGVRAARLHVESEQQLACADEQCGRQNIEWASLLVQSADIDLVNAAVRLGYDIVDTRFTLTKVLDPTPDRSAVELADERDSDEMAAIAATAFPSSRFFVDQHLDNTQCALFYETWVRNSFNGQMADAVVVSRSDGRVDGFVTMRLGESGGGSLPLVAVAAASRGRGIGSRLLDDALGWLGAHGATSIDVVTQLSNTPAIRLYEAAGFRTSESALWLHRWY